MRIVIATWGSHGDLHPALGLATELRDRGHAVTVATMPVFRDDVEREQLTFHPVRPDVDPYDRGLVARMMDARRGTEVIVRGLLMSALRDSASDLRPAVAAADVVISHPVTFAAPILAGHLGKPWASMVLAPMSFFSASDVPVLPPAPWLRLLAARWPWLSRGIVSMAHRATRSWMTPVDALRAELGQPDAGHPLFEGQHSPRLVLALFSRVLADPQPDWPANVVVTGPVVYRPRGSASLPPELVGFLDDGPPPVVFTLGTSAVGAPGRFYEESLAAVRDVGCRAVLLVGHHAVNRPAGTLPPGVIAVEYASHAALFPRASVVVHQGGAGTLHQALASGRPMIVVPYAHDQPDNADRARRLGVARIIPAKRYRASRVAAGLRVLMNEPSYAAAGARVAAVVRSENGVGTACDAIQKMAH